MVAAAPAQLAEFAASLRNEHHALRAFVALLETEQNALVEGQTDELLDLADSKTRLIDQLNQLGAIRKRFQSQHSDPATADNLEAWLRQYAAAELPLWNEMRQLAARAQQLNQTNGELIQVKLRHNQQALAVLHNAAHSASLYGRDGQHNLPGMGRKLGAV